jgi:hypothetical protein
MFEDSWCLLKHIRHFTSSTGQLQSSALVRRGDNDRHVSSCMLDALHKVSFYSAGSIQPTKLLIDVGIHSPRTLEAA